MERRDKIVEVGESENAEEIFGGDRPDVCICPDASANPNLIEKPVTVKGYRLKGGYFSVSVESGMDVEEAGGLINDLAKKSDKEKDSLKITATSPLGKAEYQASELDMKKVIEEVGGLTEAVWDDSKLLGFIGYVRVDTPLLTFGFRPKPDGMEAFAIRGKNEDVELITEFITKASGGRVSDERIKSFLERLFEV